MRNKQQNKKARKNKTNWGKLRGEKTLSRRGQL